MIAFAVIMVVVAVGMPLLYAWKLWRLDETSRAAWTIIVADAAAIMALVLIVARWDIVGIHVRYLLAAAFLLAAIVSLARHWNRAWRWRAVWSGHKTDLLSAAAVAAALVYVVGGLVPEQRQVELAFPLEGGDFVVGQGGGNRLLNHHAGHRQQRRAADITAVNRWGFRAAGLLPERLESYAIDGAAVVSPCQGLVTAVADGLPDLPPPRSDPGNPAGNHVVIDCGAATVELAHLRRGSVAVAEGEQIAVGQSLGRIGNSGNTTEPHLHIHAYDRATGDGIEMLFDGERPLRNRIYKR